MKISNGFFVNKLIFIHGHTSFFRLKKLLSKKYLGSTISWDDTLNKENDARFSRASQTLGRLCKRVLDLHNICLSMKLKKCTMQWSSLLSSLNAKLEKLFAPYLESHYRITSPILKFWTKLDQDWLNAHQGTSSMYLYGELLCSKGKAKKTVQKCN